MLKTHQATLLRIYSENPEQKKIRKVSEAMKDGAVVIYPTDTVYALGCDLYNQKALDRIAKLKSYNSQKPIFSIICQDISQVSQYTKVIPNEIFKILKKALPGPYTFVLEANNKIPKALNQNRKTIGVRVPENDVCLSLVRELGNPMITTSIKDDDAIVEYITDPQMIYEHFNNKVDFVIDGGISGNVPSSVIDCTSGEPLLERKGLGSLENIF